MVNKGLQCQAYSFKFKNNFRFLLGYLIQTRHYNSPINNYWFYCVLLSLHNWIWTTIKQVQLTTFFDGAATIRPTRQSRSIALIFNTKCLPWLTNPLILCHIINSVGGVGRWSISFLSRALFEDCWMDSFHADIMTCNSWR